MDSETMSNCSTTYLLGNSSIVRWPVLGKVFTIHALAAVHRMGSDRRALQWQRAPSCVLQTNLEHDVYERLTNLQEGIIPKKKAATDDDLHRINELIQVWWVLNPLGHESIFFPPSFIYLDYIF